MAPPSSRASPAGCVWLDTHLPCRHLPGLPLPLPLLAAGYDQGNLNWLAAFEVEPASDVMALWVWKTEQLTPLEAQVSCPSC